MILPQTAFAQMNVDVSHGDVTIDNTHVTYYDSNGKQVRAAHQGAVAVTQSDAKNTGDIVVTAAKPVSITLDRIRAAMLLDGAQIAAEEAAPIAVIGGSGIGIYVIGGNVKAVSSHSGAGIGGGWTGKAKNISISGDAVVTAEGKEKAANVGNGAEYNGGQMTDNVDISKLSTFGSYNKTPGKAEPVQSIPLAPEATVTEETGE